MKQLFEGIKNYQNTIFPQQKELFSKLAKGQRPHTLFITCSDSRIDPNLMTQSKPGDLFVLRNAGNLVPPYGASNGGEESAIEYAVNGLGVHQIVVCGHAYCGAMAALSGTADLSQLPATKAWLKHANATESIMKTKKIDKPENYIMENVLMQIKNLKTHPPVAAALKTKKLKIYAWVYDFEHGDVLVYEKNKNSFVSTAELDMGKLELCEL